MLKAITLSLLGTTSLVLLGLAAPKASAAALPPDDAGATLPCIASQECVPAPECEGSGSCTITVEPLPDGNCLVRCTAEDGTTQTCIIECSETECETPQPCETRRDC